MVLKEDRYKRCSRITPLIVRKTPIHVVGVGSGGSWVTALLAKMGFENISICDFDIVEDHNLQSQIYLEEHIGMNKVDAMKDYCERANGHIAISTINEPFSSGHKEFQNAELVVFGVDDNDVRKEIFESLHDGQLYIDGRMNGAFYELITGIKGIDDDVYLEKRRFPTEEATSTECGTQASAFNGAIEGGRIVSYIIGLLTDNEETPKTISDCSRTYQVNTNHL